MARRTKAELARENEQLREQLAEEGLRGANQQLRASNQQLEATNQQLRATEQQFRAANQQLEATNQQLRAAEQKLRRSEQRLMTAGKVAYDLIYEWDVATDALTWFGDIDGLLGYDEGAISGDISAWLALLHPEDQAALAGAVEHHRVSTEPYQFEYRVKHSDGRYRTWLDKAQPLLDAAGRPYRWIGVCSDVTARRQAEGALRQEKEFTDTALDAQQDTFFLFDPVTGKALRWNRAFRDVSGYTDEEIARLPAPDSYYSATDLERARRFVKEVLAEGGGTIELGLICKDGHTVPTEYRVSVIRDEAGDPQCIISIGRDITERKRADEALRTRERELRLLVQHLHAGVVVHAPDTSILLANDQACVLLGLSLDQMTGKTAVDPAWRFVRDDGTPMPLEEYPVERVLALLEPVRDQVVGIDRPATGDRVWVLVNAFPDLDERGGVRQVVVTFVDVTAPRRAEEALRTREEFLDTLLEAIPIPVFYKDTAGRYVGANQAFEAFFGATREQVIGKTLFDITTPELAAKYEAKDSELYEQGGTQAHECQVTDAHGSVRDIIVSKATFGGGDGNAAGLIGALFDMTGQKRAEARIESLARFPAENPNPVLRVGRDGTIEYANAAAASLVTAIAEPTGACVLTQWRERIVAVLQSGHSEEAEIRTGGSCFSATFAPVGDHGYVNIYARDVTEKLAMEAQLRQSQKLEAIGQLAGGVAHDFNNVIMGIMNYVELCRDGVDADHPIREWLDDITHDAQRSADMTRQLLALARKQTISPKVLDLNDTVSGMLKLLRRLIGEDVNLAWMPGLDLWPVKLDPGQVSQVLTNLCVNARDAIGGVGRITIDTGLATLDQAYCATQADAVPGDYVVLTVSDTGCGMDADVLNRMFEPFFTTKAVGHGTGLGLATVYGIVKQNRGHVGVHSELGRGSTFRIYLPRFKGEQASVTEAEPETVAARLHGDETILLVEDERSIRVTTELFLADLGYNVLTAAAPEEALRLVDEHAGDIQLLVTDVVMPGMSGRDLATELAQRYPDVGCLFMSGYPADVIAHRGALDEGVEFLSKPVPRQALARKIREMLGG